MSEMPVNELMKPLENGQPAVSCYSDFRRITGQEDNGETFRVWLLAAATLMLPPEGRA